MLKKKNIATMMAAATVATSVAPAFAATIVTETVKKGSDEQKALVDDLRTLLAEGTKFETENFKGESVYEIRTTKATLTSTDADYLLTDNNTDSVENVLALEKKIEALEKDEKLYVYVIDKGHAVVNGKVSDVNANNDDIDEETLAVVTIDNTITKTEEYQVSDLYDGEYVTEKGFELVELILNGAKDPQYKNIDITVSDINKTSNKEMSFDITFDIDYLDTSKDDEDGTYIVRVTGDDLADINDLHQIITAAKSGDNETGAEKLIGDTRFETAVAIANETYKDQTTPATIVLVNETSMIDGLTAAPLAAALDAAVLLTKTDEIPTATLDYIKASMKDNGGVTNVKIVGGTGVVSDKVKSQLQAMGVEVERLGGEDRHETSVAVAVKLSKLANVAMDKAFIVAATGEADAMSIAPVAAKDGEIAPIIVEGFDGMSTTANELLKSANDIDVIGGKVSEETQEAYKKRSGYDFIAGEDRFETNAKIVRNYFEAGASAIYVAKDGYTENNNEVLVDALAAGTLAAKENAAIILASEKLTTKQEEAVELVSTEVTTVTQIGGGVKHSVVKQIAEILGFTK